MSELIQMLHNMTEQIKSKMAELGIENVHCAVEYSGKNDVRFATIFTEDENHHYYTNSSKCNTDRDWYEYADQMNGYERSEKNETVAS